jgi:predicted DNA-binding protein
MANPGKKSKKKPGRPKGAPTKSASFRLPEELLEKLADLAENQERSQTTLVKRALEAYLADQEESD